MENKEPTTRKQRNGVRLMARQLDASNKATHEMASGQI